MTQFSYDPAIQTAFSHLAGGVIHATSVVNIPTPPEVLALYQAEQTAVKARIGETPLSEIPGLAGWRAAFRQFGVDPTQYRSAAESLLRRLTKKGDIPSINLLVDLGNLIAIRHALPVAIIDTRAITGDIRVHYADGTERFTNLNAEGPDPPKPGEVIFSDAAREVIARRWCWRQSEASAARLDTTDILITIEAQHSGGRTQVEQAIDELRALMEMYAGGTTRAELIV